MGGAASKPPHEMLAICISDGRFFECQPVREVRKRRTHYRPSATRDEDVKDETSSLYSNDGDEENNNDPITTDGPPSDRLEHSRPSLSIGSFFSATAKAWVATAEARVRSAVAAVKNAVQRVKELGILGTARMAGDWVKAHPWETAMVVGAIAMVGCTAGLLAGLGFTSAGVAAASTAASIQAGIGNVVAGSLFATCTSAMMGGYGVPIIFGGVSAVWVMGVGAVRAWRERRYGRTHPGAIASITTDQNALATVGKVVEQVTNATVLGGMITAAYCVYVVKRWKLNRDMGKEKDQ